MAASTALLAACTDPAPRPAEVLPSLKEAFPDYKLGVAITDLQCCNWDSLGDALILQHFNSVSCVGRMDMNIVHSKQYTYDLGQADLFVKFGEDHGMQVIGGALISVPKAPSWFCLDKDHNPVKADELRKRIKEHITYLLDHYRDRVSGWEVVSGAINEDGSYNDNSLYKILGEEYIPLAFECAQATDPRTELYLHDADITTPGRREAYIKLIKSLRASGKRVDGIGTEYHMQLDVEPDWDALEETLIAFGKAGVPVQFSAVDLSVLPQDSLKVKGEALNPYTQGLPDSISAKWNARMTKFLSVVDKHKDKVSRVTVWTVSDKDSYLNNSPIRKRTDYPVWFDRKGRMKPFLVERMKQYGIEVNQ